MHLHEASLHAWMHADEAPIRDASFLEHTRESLYVEHAWAQRTGCSKMSYSKVSKVWLRMSQGSEVCMPQCGCLVVNEADS